MTFDFIDALEEACDKEKVPFLVIIQSGDGERATMRVNLEHWKNANNDWSIREDVIDAIEACLDQQEEDE